jgi:hypothetical protein
LVRPWQEVKDAYFLLTLAAEFAIIYISLNTSLPKIAEDETKIKNK